MAKQKTLEESIQKFIVDRVREHWDDFQRAYLLSNMGYAIKREFAESAVAMPKGLKDFLRQWPIVAEVSYPGIAEKVGLVPLGVELPEDIRVLFKPKDVRDEKTPVYEDAFWDAFINPITKKRYISIDLDGNVVVADTSAPDHAAKTWELLPEDIEIHQPGVPIAEKVRVTHKKIDDWLSRHEVERAHFLKSRGKSLPKSTVDRVSMIKALFGDLTKEDQARISIPLDILLKIIAQR